MFVRFLGHFWERRKAKVKVIYDTVLCIVCPHFHIFILKYLSMREIRCLCRQMHSRRCAGMLDLGWRRVTAGFPEGSTPLPCRLPPPVSCPVPSSFYSTSHRAMVRPPARPYGFYHFSIELSRVKAFNTWVFGTHSNSLSRHLDSFSILKSWPFFFFFLVFPTGGVRRQGLHSGCFSTYGHGCHQVSWSRLCLQTTVGNCSHLAQVQ